MSGEERVVIVDWSGVTKVLGRRWYLKGVLKGRWVFFRWRWGRRVF